MTKYLSIVFLIVTVSTLIWYASNSKQSTVVIDAASAQINPSSSSTPSSIKKLNPYKLYNVPSELKLNAKQIKSVTLAVETFKNESKIPDDKKNIDNYFLEWRQDDKVYMVSFLVKRDPKKNYVGGETENGIDVTYVIDKSTNQIAAQVFYK